MRFYQKYKRIIKRSACLFLLISLITGAFPVFAEEETGGESPLQQEAAVILQDEFQARTKQFLSDDRWKNGADWPNGQRPLISRWGSIGCCAYAMDFAKFVYGIDGVRVAGEEYKDVEEIRAGDIVHVSPEHWFVVLERNGDQLKTAEGSWGSKVQVGYSCYKIDDGVLINTAIGDERVNKIVEAFHFTISDVSHREIRESTGESSSRCMEIVREGVSSAN